jgi:uncharacterized protein YfaS (alpha-2-macroglobulin family)
MTASPANDSTFAPLWASVEQHLANALPASALKTVDAILVKARAAVNAVHTTKALLYKAALTAEAQENGELQLVQDLSAAIAQTKQSTEFIQRAVLQSALAEFYHEYYERHRWKFANRTATNDAKSSDFRTWDTRTILDTARALYLASVADAERLHAVRVKDIPDLMGRGYSDGKRRTNLRPTLFDVLAWRALDFLNNSSHALPTPEREFELTTLDGFKPASDFAALAFFSPEANTTNGTSDPVFLTLQLYQRLLAAHLNDSSTSAHAALVDTDLARLRYARAHTLHEDKDAAYKQALERLITSLTANPATEPLTDEARYELAHYWFSAGDKGSDYAQAINICEHVIAKHRSTPTSGLQNCLALKDQILAKSLSLSVERTVLPNAPFLVSVEYRNVKRLHFRVVKLDNQEFSPFAEDNESHNLSRKQFTKLLQRPPFLAWTQDLPDTADYKSHRTEIPAALKTTSGTGLPLGRYVLVASERSDFTDSGNGMAYAPLQVSRLTLFQQTGLNINAATFFVTDALTGEPLQGVAATVSTWEYDYSKHRNKWRAIANGLQTAADGSFSVAPPEQHSYNALYVQLKRGDDTFLSNNYHAGHSYTQGAARHAMQRTTQRTMFFTDRSIYRPGQTVYFKGIMIDENPEKPDYKTLAGISTTVELRDANAQEAGKRTLLTNEYGSVQGALTLPVGRLNGAFTLRNETGAVTIRVEEYKRPKFEATFNPLKASPRLGEAVSLTVSARAYTGSMLDGATVRYHVVRTVRYPYWAYRCWWLPAPPAADKEIARGTSTTNERGECTITFPALPDKSADRRSLPVFHYRVMADVTDVNGETHSAETSVAVGYVAVQLSISAPNQVERSALNSTSALVQMSVNARNLNDQPLATSGTLVVERLAEPARIQTNSSLILRQRLFTEPDRFALAEAEFTRSFPNDVYKREDRIESWLVEREILNTPFTCDAQGNFIIPQTALQSLPAGVYRITASAADVSGEMLTAREHFTLFDKAASMPPRRAALMVLPLKTRCEPPETASLLVGSSSGGQMLYQIEQNGKLLKQEWIKCMGQRTIEIPVSEAERGNVFVHFTLVHNGRIFTQHHTIVVPWSNKELTLETSTFRSKLQPGSKEEWRITVRGTKADALAREAAETLVSMYDASLDALAVSSWERFAWRSAYTRLSTNTSAVGVALSELWGDKWWSIRSGIAPVYPRLDTDVLEQALGWSRFGGARYSRSKRVKSAAPGNMADQDGLAFAAAPMAAEAVSDEKQQSRSTGDNAETRLQKQPQASSNKPVLDMSNVKARANLQETAFFFPQLRTDTSGAVTFAFTMPEALTKWRLHAFAHTPDLRTGYTEATAITQKPLMLLPNLPRFLREGDTITLPVKITSLAERALEGAAQLTLMDAATMKPVDAAFKLTAEKAQQPFRLNAGRSSVVAWRVVVPEGVDAVVVRVVAKANAGASASAEMFSDGEESALPIVPNRMMVTETLPFWVRGKEQRSFELKKLVNAKKPSTLRHYRLTLEMTSNPAWYAIQALPYMMEYAFECAEQTFTCFSANAIAAHVAHSNPKMKVVFEQWKTSADGSTLLSNLEKNQDVKTALLTETPWVLQGKDESERKRRVGLLFDLNRMASERETTFKKLEQMQLASGAFAWFAGMPESRFVTQYILAGIGHLKRLGVSLESSLEPKLEPSLNTRLQAMARKALHWCDAEMNREYKDLKRQASFNKTNNYLGSTAIQYLYARAYFADEELPTECNEAFTFWLEQAKAHWPKQSLMAQGMITLALHAFDQRGSVRQTMLQSFRERALRSEEMGMYWKGNVASWWWYQAPIETQALMIEVFDVVAKDTKAVEELKIWLLKQKQTQDWKTTKATAEACYALLLRGTDVLASDTRVDVQLGAMKIEPRKSDAIKAGGGVEAGTGYYTMSWSGGDVKPEMGKVTLTQSDEGDNGINSIAWGGLYWQYFENLDNITAAADTRPPLSIEKKLYRQTTTGKGLVAEPITAQQPLKVGDVLKVRVEIRSDRDMEYVHLKDMRGAGLEPLTTLSGYKWQGGLGYYETMKDVSANFFMGWLPKGVYVFEYSLRATHEGTFANGITTIQCLYAPEFASHSAGTTVTIR